MSGPIIYPSTGSAAAVQVFGGSANQFIPPLGSQIDAFPSVGPAQNPTINTSVPSGGNASEAVGKGTPFIPPLGSQTDTFLSGDPVYPPAPGNPGSAELFGQDAPPDDAEKFLSGNPETPTTNDSEETGIDLFYAGEQPFLFGSGNPPSITTNDPIFE
jgi:hypothetical protein